METIGKQKLWSIATSGKAIETSCTAIRKSTAASASDYLDLARQVSELQFLNRDFVLMFRGQAQDYRNKSRNTTLKPSLFRAGREGLVPKKETLEKRFEQLRKAEAILVKTYAATGFGGKTLLQRQKILRWSILQHYGVCHTPLLDVTHSLRVAASFASEGALEEAFVFVLGVPNLSGAVTASAEGGLQIVRLASVCPPSAVRPHIQEGYLLGEYPEMSGVDQKEHYTNFEIDFGRRLIAKFRFEPKSFWKGATFPPMTREALYPDATDPVFLIAKSIKDQLAQKA